jgi:acyl-coenzyme A synthetase/AMP-(fatty) acid ligase
MRRAHEQCTGGNVNTFIVLKVGLRPSVQAIVDYCREHLAAHNVSRAVQFVDDLPKISTEKVMRRDLRTLDEY